MNGAGEIREEYMKEVPPPIIRIRGWVEDIHEM